MKRYLTFDKMFFFNDYILTYKLTQTCVYNIFHSAQVLHSDYGLHANNFIFGNFSLFKLSLIPSLH